MSTPEHEKMGNMSEKDLKMMGLRPDAKEK